MTELESERPKPLRVRSDDELPAVCRYCERTTWVEVATEPPAQCRWCGEGGTWWKP
jgi:hypothetical protein